MLLQLSHESAKILNHPKLKLNNYTLQGKLSTSAIITLIDYIIDQLEKGDMIFLAYNKVFDCLSHDFILENLDLLGVQQITKTWFNADRCKSAYKDTAEQKGKAWLAQKGKVWHAE